MTPRITSLATTKLIGKRQIMSYTNNKTGEPWRSFMPVRKNIRNRIGTDFYSVAIYDPFYFANFNPDKQFEKWATVTVSDFNGIPEGM